MSWKPRLVALFVVSLVAGGSAAAVLRRSDPAPFPSTTAMARNGFAVWPADTPSEAVEECADAAEWRKDPKQVALRFAAEVMGYPAPTVDDDFASEDKDSFRSLINSRKVKGVFLGSVLDIDRFGECWYVTGGEGREGGWGIDIVTLEGGSKLLVPVACCGGRVEVGWGDWTKTFRSRKEPVELLVPVPQEAHGHPGHYIVTHFDKSGVSEVVGARRLPPLPTDEGAEELTPIDLGRRPEDRKLCRMEWTRKANPERTLNQLSSIFSGGLELTKAGYPRFDSRSRQRLGSAFEWLLRLDDADLRVSFSKAAKRCWVVRSIVPRGPRIIESASAGAHSVTIDLSPGRADKVVVYLNAGDETRAVSIQTKRFLDEPFSVSRGPDLRSGDEAVPGFVMAITYRDGNLHSVEYRTFEVPRSDP